MDKRYIFKVESEKFRLEYSYSGREDNSEIKVEKSNITVRLIDKVNSLVEYLPEKIRWELNFIDKFIPLHPYYPFKFGDIFNDFAFIAIENELIKLDLENGRIIMSNELTNTRIKFVSKFESRIIVMFDFENFDIAKHNSNLKMLDKEGEVIWSAKLINSPDGQLYDHVRTSQGKIEAWSGSMYTSVDKRNGNIDSPQFVK